MYDENVKANENEGVYFAKNSHGSTSTIDIEKWIEKNFDVKDVEKMLQEEETKMINGKTKYYTMKEFENFANQVVYGK